MDLLLRFHNKVKLNDNGCHIWTGYTDDDGYGKFGIKNKIISSHRFSYNLYKGQIPNNMEIHHICNNTSCVNPNHLEVVTHKENLILGNSPSSINRDKTHCPKGHKYTKENTYFSNKRRYCRKCRKCR